MLDIMNKGESNEEKDISETELVASKEEAGPDDEEEETEEELGAEHIKILLSTKLKKIVLYDVSKEMMKKIMDALNTDSNSAVLTVFEHGLVVSKQRICMTNLSMKSKEREREVNEHMYG